MKLKDKILEILEQNRGTQVSGESIAGQLSVSRSAVWKAINDLRREGVSVNSVRSGGYTLPEEDDSLWVQGICALLGESGYSVHTAAEVTSTNTVLKELAHQGAPDGYVLAAKRQTAGKGRLGRSFYSPEGTGLYMSIILRPKMNAQDALFVTAAAAVAVCRAIEECCPDGETPMIKWVNDICVGGKKVCGILTEAAVDFESGGLEYAVLGMGVNISEPDGGFPEDVRGVAGSLFGSRRCENMRNRLAAAILRNLRQLPQDHMSPEILEEYRRRSLLTGKHAYVHRGDEVRPCLVLGVDDRARLIVKYDDGSEQILSSGEVSVRLEK